MRRALLNLTFKMAFLVMAPKEFGCFRSYCQHTCLYSFHASLNSRYSQLLYLGYWMLNLSRYLLL